MSAGVGGMYGERERPEVYVLLVEDDQDDFYLTQDLLERVESRKYRVAWAASYDAARQELRERAYDVALVDYRIAERTGLEFIREVGPLYPKTPMILLTGLRSEDVDHAAQEAGAADYLVKDSLTEELLDRSIRYACQQAQRWGLLDTVLSNASSGMIAVSWAGVPTIWNKQALRALGLGHLSVASAPSADVAKALARRCPSDQPAGEFTTSDGMAFEWSTADEPGGGKVIVLHDISRRARAEAMLRQAVSDAEAANAAKSVFLASMSHELRTPLNGILGMARVLETTPLDEIQREHVDIIKTSGHGLLGIINDILDLSKIEAGRMEIEDGEVAIATITDDVLKMLAPNAHAKGLEIAGFVDPRLPRALRGDPLRVKQVLTNLVGNALKFTENGSVTVSVAPEMREGRRFICVSVADTGIGIPADKLPRLFSRFSQVDATTTRKYGGSGLGLALCKEIVNLMGGAIACQSDEGRGSTFSFRLPAEETNAAADQVRETMVQELNGTSVLLISPSAGLGHALRGYVRLMNGTLTQTSNETVALSSLSQRSYHAIVFDRLETGDGPDRLLQAIAAIPPPRVPLLIAMRQGDGEPLPSEAAFGLVLQRPFTREAFDRIAQRLREAGETARRSPKLSPSLAAVTEKHLKILVAEDNEPNARVASAMLKSAGFRTEIAGNGRIALEKVQAGRFDVVLMDVQMPIMDGIEATRRLRATEAGAKIPILGLTANAMREDRQRCMEAGMNDHIPKPVDWDKLIGLLKGLEREIYGA